MRLLKALSPLAASRFALMVKGSKLRLLRCESDEPASDGDFVKTCTKATIRCRCGDGSIRGGDARPLNSSASPKRHFGIAPRAPLYPTPPP